MRSAPPTAAARSAAAIVQERIRTYNFPQGRVTDHRIDLTLYKLPQVIAGEALDEIVDALTTDHQASLLSAEDRPAAGTRA